MIIKRLPNVLVLLISLLFVATSYADTGKSFLWKIQLQGPSQEVSATILGSVHFADKRFYPLSAAIESAFKNASALVLEANILAIDNAQLNADMQAKGFYPAGQSIADHITADTLKLLKDYLAKNKIPYKNIQKFRPIMLAVGLASTQLMKLGFSPEQGIDLHFAKRAQGKIPSLELESIKQQIDLIFGLPDEEAFLRYTLQDLEQTGDVFRKIMEAWLAGDAQAMYTHTLAPLENEAEAQSMLEIMFYQRNRQMTNKIKTLMQSHKDLFIVVGSGHLLGDKGILKLLEQAGYSVQQQ